MPFPDTVPTLVDPSLTLRALGEEDIAPWFVRASDAEAADLAGDPVPASIDLGRPWLERQHGVFRRRAGIRWAIVPNGSPVSVGTVALTLLTDEPQVAELGIVIARAHWGRGLGTTAAQAALRFGWAAWGLREVRAEVLVRNPASIRLLLKAGFQPLRELPPTADEPEPMRLYHQHAPAG